MIQMELLGGAGMLERGTQVVRLMSRKYQVSPRIITFRILFLENDTLGYCISKKYVSLISGMWNI